MEVVDSNILRALVYECMHQGPRSRKRLVLSIFSHRSFLLLLRRGRRLRRALALLDRHRMREALRNLCEQVRHACEDLRVLEHHRRIDLVERLKGRPLYNETEQNSSGRRCRGTPSIRDLFPHE
jgi:Cdc6-like AAA superfamily ATPase